MDLFDQKNIKPMLISEMKSPFNSPDWIYELKLDGIRCLAYLNELETDLRNKRNMKLLPRFPELRQIHQQVTGKCILDGELIILSNGVPDFYELQRRTMMSDSFKMELAYRKHPASYVAYDIIYYNGRQVTDLPLNKRKELLEDVVNETVDIAVSRFVAEKGIELYHLADSQKLEGVVAKRRDSKYFFDKRSKDWIKFKRMSDEDFVICGYIRKANSNTLILGQYKGDMLVYKGSVTFGVKHDFLSHYPCQILPSSPFTLAPTFQDEVTWLHPSLVCVVEYMPNTKDSLRQPVFKGIRDDKTPMECQVKA